MQNHNPTVIERLAYLESQIAGMDARQEEMYEDVKALIAIRHKAGGAFILLSMIFGSGVVGSFLLLINWFKSFH